MCALALIPPCVLLVTYRSCYPIAVQHVLVQLKQLDQGEHHLAVRYGYSCATTTATSNWRLRRTFFAVMQSKSLPNKTVTQSNSVSRQHINHGHVIAWCFAWCFAQRTRYTVYYKPRVVRTPEKEKPPTSHPPTPQTLAHDGLLARTTCRAAAQILKLLTGASESSVKQVHRSTWPA